MGPGFVNVAFIINIWDNQIFPNLLWLKKTVSLKWSDLFINNWYSTDEKESPQEA